jgi:hypothetical protein
MSDDFWANTPQEPRQPEVEIRDVSTPASPRCERCGDARQIVDPGISPRGPVEAVPCPACAASPPPEPQEWACDLCDGKGKYYPRAEVPASYEAPWCPICHGSGTVPPEPQGTDEERSE